MKSIWSSPIWTIGVLVVTLTFVVWGIILIVKVQQQREEMRGCVSMISKLNALETSIQELEKAILDDNLNQPPDSALNFWRQKLAGYSRHKANLLADNDNQLQKVEPLLSKLDSTTNRIDQILTEKLLSDADTPEAEGTEIKLHREINAAFGLVQEATHHFRQRLSYLSGALAAEWQSLYVLVFIACFLVMLLAAVLHFHQKDLISRRRTEKILRQITAEFRAIFKSIPDAVVFTDINHEIIMVNPAFSSLFGYNPEEVMGKESLLLYNNADDFSLLGKMHSANNGGGNNKLREIHYRRKSGEAFIGETVATRVEHSEGKLLGFFCIVRDITQRKRAEEALSEAHNKLEQWVNERTEDLMRANDEVKRFAYIVSHDLRAPLVNIKGFASELRHAFESIQSGMGEAFPHLKEDNQKEITELLEEEIPESLQFIDSAASRMGSLIDAVLKLSRLGRRELHFERINVRVLVQKILESLAHQIEQRNIEVNVGALPRIIADRTSMEQIFGNILVNAITYLEPDRPGKIEISGERRGQETIYQIIDNGRGISEEDMPKVFEPFSRVGKQNLPGEGMGLAYVQTLVRRHGGRIWCESKIGQGTTFSFALSNRTTNGNEVV